MIATRVHKEQTKFYGIDRNGRNGQAHEIIKLIAYKLSPTLNIHAQN